MRCESESYSRGCDSAALLIRQRSDSNVIADNDLRWSGDGFFLSGHQPGLEPSVGNLVIRNDASHAYHNAFEATWSWGTTFLENRADSAAYAFWLGYSTGATVRGNTAVGSREVAIAIEHGSDNEIAGNILIGGKDGIKLFTSAPSGPASRGYRINDNMISRFGRGLVLQGTTQARVRGNVFDSDNESLVADASCEGCGGAGERVPAAGPVLCHCAGAECGCQLLGERVGGGDGREDLRERGAGAMASGRRGRLLASSTGWRGSGAARGSGAIAPCFETQSRRAEPQPPHSPTHL